MRRPEFIALLAAGNADQLALTINVNDIAAHRLGRQSARCYREGAVILDRPAFFQSRVAHGEDCRRRGALELRLFQARLCPLLDGGLQWRFWIERIERQRW